MCKHYARTRWEFCARPVRLTSCRLHSRYLGYHVISRMSREALPIIACIMRQTKTSPDLGANINGSLAYLGQPLRPKESIALF